MRDISSLIERRIWYNKRLINRIATIASKVQNYALMNQHENARFSSKQCIIYSCFEYSIWVVIWIFVFKRPCVINITNKPLVHCSEELLTRILQTLNQSFHLCRSQQIGTDTFLIARRIKYTSFLTAKRTKEWKLMDLKQYCLINQRKTKSNTKCYLRMTLNCIRQSYICRHHYVGH